MRYAKRGHCSPPTMCKRRKETLQKHSEDIAISSKYHQKNEFYADRALADIQYVIAKGRIVACYIHDGKGLILAGIIFGMGNKFAWMDFNNKTFINPRMLKTHSTWFEAATVREEVGFSQDTSIYFRTIRKR